MNPIIHREMIHLSNIDLFVRDTKTKGQVILCLHGRWGRGETWVDFIQHYGDRYRVIAPDQRGHGLSGKPIAKYTNEEMAEDMVNLLDHYHLDQAIVVGHSMGGGIAGTLAALHPEHVLAAAILDKSAKGPDKENPIPLDQLKNDDPVTKQWPLPFRSLQEAQKFIKNDMESELSYSYFISSLVETVEGYQMMFSNQAMAANIAYYKNWYDLLPKIQCPVMLVRSSSHEAVCDADFEKMKSLISRCMAFEMSEPDHNVHLSNKNEFYRYFDEFLRNLA